MIRPDVAAKWAAYRRGWAERFWSRVDKNGDCWIWTGAVTSGGYGSAKGPDRRSYVAHRIAFFLTYGGISLAAPTQSDIAKYVLHRCDNRKCCRPDHLFLGTYTDNMLDMYGKQRHPVYRGALHKNAKLTNKQVTEIRERYAAGELQVPLTKEYGVSQRVISLVVRRESYT